MTFARRLLVVTLLAIGVASTRCEKPDVATTSSLDGVSETASSTVVARMDSAILKEASVDAEPVGTVLEGDLLTVLAEKGEFSKVNVRATGTTGWIDSNLCLRLPPSPYWEGDTSKARQVAQRIYQDKFLVQRTPEGRVRFPIGKVQVETAFSTITFQALRGEPRPIFLREDAKQLGLHWLARMPQLFPDWREPSIYVRGFDGTVEYLMTMGRDKVAHFL